MKSILNWFIKNSFILSIISFSVSLTIYIIHFIYYRYSFPPINPDEASFISPAYDLVHKNRFSTSIHSSFLPGADTYTYWMPPLYMLILAVYLKLVGFSLVKAKFFSFTCYLIAGITLSYTTTNKVNKFWVLSILLCCPYIIIASSTIRMESIGFLVTCLTIIAIKNNANSVILAILAGATILIHPMFLACGLSIAIIVINRKNWHQFLIFTVIVLFMIIPYIWYIAQDPAIFWEQMSLQLNRKAETSLFKINFSYFVQFAPMSIISLGLIYKSVRRSELSIFLTFGLSLTTILILKSQEFNYHLYIIPYMITVVALVMDEQKSLYIYKLNPFIIINLIFLLLLFQKLKNNNFINDNTIYEMVDLINLSDKEWNGQEILVSNSALDLTSFILLNNQKVERVNAISVLTDSLWYKKFNYVVYVEDKKEITDNLCGFWCNWNRILSYKTKNGQFNLVIFRNPSLTK